MCGFKGVLQAQEWAIWGLQLGSGYAMFSARAEMSRCLRTHSVPIA